MKIIFQILFIFCSFIANAQYYTPENQAKPEKKGLLKDWKQKIFFGGNVGLSFGRYYTYVEASPLIGYKIHPKVSVGTSLTYIYIKNTIGYRLSTPSSQTVVYYNYSSNIFGISPFTRVFLTEWLFAHGEFNLLNGDVIYQKSTPDYFFEKREFIGIPLLGGGIHYKLGAKGGIMFMALYNFAFDRIRGRFPLYQSPVIIRAGFYF